MGRRLDPDRLRRVLLLLLPGAAGVYLAFRSGGSVAGIAAIFAVLCLVVLVLRAAPGTFDAAVSARVANAVLLALPGALTVYFAFNAGGFFPETPALVAVVLILILVVRITTAEGPFAGFGWPVAIATGALGLYCVWTLVSGTWSDAPARALIEFDRALVYLLALVLFGSLPRSAGSLRWMLRGIALAIVAVAVAGFLTRTLPDVFPTEPRLYEGRLGFPLTYWNGVGILTALGAILCMHLTASLREPLVVRVLAAASLPVLAATVLLTFSRGAIFAGFLGLAIYAVLGRPRGLTTAVLAAVPPGVIAVHAAWDAEILGTDRATTDAGAAEGHDVALIVGACCLAAALIRVALRPVDVRVQRFALPAHLRRRVIGAAWVAALVAAVAVVVAVDLPERIDTQYDKFVDSSTAGRPEVARDRLSDAANAGRIEQWEVALDGFERAELNGQGAGTYGNEWMQERPNTLVVDNAHSLFLETLQELGLVGLVLVSVALLAILAGTAPWPGRERSLHAALFAAAFSWTVHAGIDWDWEMPAVTVWLFCVGGAALARAGEELPTGVAASDRPRRVRFTHRRRKEPGSAPSAGQARRVRFVKRQPKAATALPSSGARLVFATLVLIGALAPALVLVSQRQLDDAADAFENGDCATATERATASIRTLEIRPEPYEVLAFCDVREGFDRLGVAALDRALDRDPDNWEFHYGLAIVRGSAGLDPRSAARAALSHNPRDPLTRSLVDYVDTSDPQRWIERTRPIAENERLSVVR
jgi:O-antigen ligase